jgi:beta-glucosidase
VDAARWFDGFFNRWYLDPAVPAGSILRMPSPTASPRGHLAGPALPFVRAGDLEAISAAALDFLGVNYYSRVIMQRGCRRQAARRCRRRAGVAVTDMGWECTANACT